MFVGVPLHPASVPRIGGQKYFEIVLHHLTIRQFAKIVEHLTDFFLGVVGSYHNAWSQASGCPSLGCLLQVRGAGEGQAHAEFIVTTAGIFKYPWRRDSLAVLNFQEMIQFIELDMLTVREEPVVETVSQVFDTVWIETFYSLIPRPYFSTYKRSLLWGWGSFIVWSGGLSA